MLARHRVFRRRKHESSADDRLTAFLYAQPSLVEGIGRAFDLGHELTDYNFSLAPMQADEFALRLDIRAVGRDMHQGVEDAPFPGRRGPSRRSHRPRRGRRVIRG